MGKSRHSMSENKEKLLLVLPAIVVLVVFTTFPYLMTFVLGFFKLDLADPAGPKFYGLKNYVTALYDSRFWNSVRTTAIYVSVATCVEMVLGVALALLVRGLKRGRGIYQSLLLIPMVVPPIVVGLNWRLLYDANYGFINYLFSVLRLSPQTWLSQSQYALMALLIVDFWQYTPFVTLLVLAQLMSLPDEPYEACKIDGASAWQTIKFVTLPMIKPGLGVVATLRAIEAFKEFAKIYVLTSGGPGTATETLNFYVYTTGFDYYQLGYSSALATILFASALALSAVLLRANKASSGEEMSP